MIIILEKTVLTSKLILPECSNVVLVENADKSCSPSTNSRGEHLHKLVRGQLASKAVNSVNAFLQNCCGVDQNVVHSSIGGESTTAVKSNKCYVKEQTEHHCDKDDSGTNEQEQSASASGSGVVVTEAAAAALLVHHVECLEDGGLEDLLGPH